MKKSRYTEALEEWTSRIPPFLVDWRRLELRAKLIREEAEEAWESIYRYNFLGSSYSKRELAKELADLIYVTVGTAVELGIDIDRVFEEVHRSNMSKLDGMEVREDGKIKKGPNYRPPELEFVK